MTPSALVRANKIFHLYLEYLFRIYLFRIPQLFVDADKLRSFQVHHSQYFSRDVQQGKSVHAQILQHFSILQEAAEVLMSVCPSVLKTWMVGRFSKHSGNVQGRLMEN